MLTEGVLVGAIGFASAGMLFWATCAAIPLLLHLLKRHRQKIIKWAAIDLLLKVIQQQSRRVRIEQLLLLLLRMSACVLATVALARPFLQATPSAENVNLVVPPRLWIIVVDCSYSMGYQQEAGTRFSAAKARAAELVASSQIGDSFALVALSKPSKAIISRITFDRTSVSTQLDELDVMDTGADLNTCLQAIDDIVEDARDSRGDQRQIEIVILTDLGKDTWHQATSGTLHQRLGQLASKYRLNIESMASGAPVNLAVTNVSAVRTGANLLGRLRIEASIANHSPTSANRVPVQFLIDDQTEHSEFIDLGVGQSRTIQTEVEVSSSAERLVSVSIPSDRLDVDNRRDLIVPERRQVRVLCVEGNPGDARFIALAVSPTGNSDELIASQTISSIELSSQDLSNWDAVLLCGVSDLSETVASRLRKLVERGGGLLVFLGEGSSVEAWNRQSSQSERDLLGFELVEPSADQEWRVDPLDYTSPVVAPFTDFPDAGLLTTPIFRYWRIKPRADNQWIVDVGLHNSEPLIVRRRIGKGWIASWLSAPQTWQNSNGEGQAMWNAIATWPSFVPLVRQLVYVVTSGEAQSRNLIVGQPMSGTLPADSQPRVVYPNGDQSPIASAETSGDGSLNWIHDDTYRRGVYRVERSGKTVLRIAANIDTVESNLESIGQALLPKSTTTTDAEIDPATVGATEDHHDRLARIILGALLCVLVAESLLAWSLGRRLA